MREMWGEALRDWRINLKLEAFAVRDFETGKLHYRVWDSHPSLRSFSSDRRLAVEHDGQVLNSLQPRIICCWRSFRRCWRCRSS